RSRVPIRALSADGDRVAYALCPHVLGAWRPGDAAHVPLGNATVAACRPDYPQALYDLALAGDRLAYMVREGGIQVRWWLMLTTLARRDEGTAVASGADCCAGDPRQPPVGDLLGDGSLLVYGAWSAATGDLLHAWPLPDVPSTGRCRRLFCPTVRLTLDDEARGLAVYTLDGAVHLLRLRDGFDYTVPGATAAELEDTGLFYAYA